MNISRSSVRRSSSNFNRRWSRSGCENSLFQAVLAFCMLAGSAPLSAQNSWTELGTGNWFDSENWSYLMVPDSQDVVRVNNGGTAAVSGASMALSGWLDVSGSSKLELLDGLDSQLTTSTLTIGERSRGDVEVGNGAFLQINGYLGNALIVADADLGSYDAVGRLEIHSGGTVVQSGDALIGTGDRYANGTVLVHGNGSSWTMLENSASRLVIGQMGKGRVQVESGGVVSVANLVSLGENGIAEGSLLVDGAGSLFTQTIHFPSEDMRIGEAGYGSLTIQNGGRVESGITGSHLASVYAGYLSSGVGQITVDGEGSSWEIGQTLVLGHYGSAMMDISYGGQVDVGSLIVGEMSGSDGRLTVDGVNSQLKALSLKIGMEGEGGVRIGDGAHVELGGYLATSLTVGAATMGPFGKIGELEIHSGGTLVQRGGATIAAGSMMSLGGVLVHGNGSSWSLLEDSGTKLLIGEQGAGSVRVESGGVVSTQTRVLLGEKVNSIGLLLVDGAGSRFTQSANSPGDAGLWIGDAGYGTLTIRNGGQVETGITGANLSSAYAGYHSSGRGLITVEGAGSSWKVGDTLFLGHYGEGTLNISDGGKVDARALTIGGITGSEGLLTVDGVGSLLTISTGFGQQAIIGAAGYGSMEVSSGGKVVTSGNGWGYLGYESSGVGEVFVHGAGSSWTVSNSVVVGRYGEAEMSIFNGGNVTSANGTVGDQVGSEGLVTISSGGSWSLTNGTQVGRFGNGIIDVFGGGALSGYVTLGVNNGAEGELYISGTGSSWTWGGSAGSTVGLNGKGTLFAGNGAQISGVSMTVGSGSTATGRVDIVGNATRMTLSDGLIVGSSGSGTLEVRDGAQLSSRRATIGLNTTGTGEMIVRDYAIWSITGTNNFDLLEIGRSGNGRLEILNGSLVEVAHRVVVGSHSSSLSGGTGEVIVDGASWIVNNGITLASNSHATGSVMLLNSTVRTSQVEKGDADGQASWTFNSGTLQLTGNQANLFANFSDGDVNFIGGGGVIDTQQYNATINLGLQGVAGSFGKAGSGHLTLRGTNLFTGIVHVEEGILEVAGSGSINQNEGLFIHGDFRYNSSVNYTGGNVSLSGTLSGTNWRAGLSGLTVSGGRVVSPGNGVGHAVTGTQTWGSFGIYQWEINDAAGVAGLNWDLITFTETLEISSFLVQPFTIRVASLLLDGSVGEAAHFDLWNSYRWLIADSATEILTFAGDFIVDTGNFLNPYDGLWEVVRGDTVEGGTSNQLYLTYTTDVIPEPSTISFIVLALIAVLMFREYRFRRNPVRKRIS